MASKVPIKPQAKTAAATATAEETPQSTALTSVASSFLPQHDLSTEVESADTGMFFPQLKLVYPIEIRPQGPFKQNDAYVVGLSDGEAFEPLEEGYILSILDSRNVSREERATMEGGKATGKEYIRAYQGITRGATSFARSNAAYIEQHKRAALKEEGFFTGVSMVLAIIRADGHVAIGEMNLFKTQRPYWQKHLMQTAVIRSVGMQVKIASHFCNVIESGSGNAYPGPKKFNQFDFVSLEPDQIRDIGIALEAAGECYLQWLDR